MRKDVAYFTRNSTAQIVSVGLANTIALAGFEGFEYSKLNTEIMLEIAKLEEGSPEKLRLVAEFARNNAK
jgi:hypothetical protein